MIEAAGAALIGLFAGVRLGERRGRAVLNRRRCRVCGDALGDGRSVVDQGRGAYYHLRCWAGVARGDVFRTLAGAG